MPRTSTRTTHKAQTTALRSLGMGQANKRHQGPHIASNLADEGKFLPRAPNKTATVRHLPAHQAPDDQPTPQQLALLIVKMRRTIRHTVAELDQHHDAARQYRRQARIIKERNGTFDAARIAVLETLAAAEVTACKPLGADLLRAGELLADVTPMIDAGLTLAQRCDVLGVNVMDRGDLTEDDGYQRIVFAHALEDSAARRHCQWNDGPLFRAAHRVFAEFLHRPEAKALTDGLFTAGGLFSDVPMYNRAADGTMTRQPPRLRIVPGTCERQEHDAG